MISKFFSKTSPLHFIIISGVLFLAFIMTVLFATEEKLDIILVLKQGFLFIVCFLSLFVFNFFSGKNNLTKKNSYHLLLYCLFLILIPQSFLDSKIIVANLFVLFALRRTISLRSKKQRKKKIFDAAFWITLATLLCFWASLFYIVIFVGLFVFKIFDLKNWIIPFLGVLVVLIIGFSVIIVLNYPLMPLGYYRPKINLDFTALNSKLIIVASTIFFSYFLWSLVFYLKSLKSKSKKYKNSNILILVAALIAIGIIVLTPRKSGASFLFLVAPLSIIVANYIEIIKEKWFREILIWILIVAPIATLLL